jgi:hypothetical protein
MTLPFTRDRSRPPSELEILCQEAISKQVVEILIEKSGTSEGAKLGWLSRDHGKGGIEEKTPQGNPLIDEKEAGHIKSRAIRNPKYPETALINETEILREYRNKDITIRVPENSKYVRIDDREIPQEKNLLNPGREVAVEINNLYNALPNVLRNTIQSINVSSLGSPMDSPAGQIMGGGRIDGISSFNSETKKADIVFYNDKMKMDILWHESAHGLDAITPGPGEDGYFGISDSPERAAAAEKDSGKPGYYRFTTDYASKSFHNTDKKFREDFAEAVKLYMGYPERFAQEFPNRKKILDKYLGKIEKSGTSEGARLGWEHRDRGKGGIEEKKPRKDKEPIDNGIKHPNDPVMRNDDPETPNLIHDSLREFKFPEVTIRVSPTITDLYLDNSLVKIDTPVQAAKIAHDLYQTLPPVLRDPIRSINMSEDRCPMDGNGNMETTHALSSFCDASTGVSKGLNDIFFYNMRIDSRILSHEAAHGMDGRVPNPAKPGRGYGISASPEWINAVKSDGGFVSEYANISYYNSRTYTEDFADSVRHYRDEINRQHFIINCPARLKILRRLFDVA